MPLGGAMLGSIVASDFLGSQLNICFFWLKLSEVVNCRTLMFDEQVEVLNNAFFQLIMLVFFISSFQYMQN